MFPFNLFFLLLLLHLESVGNQWEILVFLCQKYTVLPDQSLTLVWNDILFYVIKKQNFNFCYYRTFSLFKSKILYTKDIYDIIWWRHEEAWDHGTSSLLLHSQICWWKSIWLHMVIYWNFIHVTLGHICRLPSFLTLL